MDLSNNFNNSLNLINLTSTYLTNSRNESDLDRKIIEIKKNITKIDNITDSIINNLKLNDANYINTLNSQIRDISNIINFQL